MAKKKIDQPGMILYFEVMEAMDNLSNDERGIFISGCYHYARYGNAPSFSGGLSILWPIAKRSLDDGRMKYYRECIDGSYASSIRWYKDKGQPIPSKEDWLLNQKKYSKEEIAIARYDKQDDREETLY